jgi:hypothetical protein
MKILIKYPSRNRKEKVLRHIEQDESNGEQS